MGTVLGTMRQIGENRRCNSYFKNLYSIKNYGFYGKDFVEKPQPVIIDVIGHNLQTVATGNFIH